MNPEVAPVFDDNVIDLFGKLSEALTPGRLSVPVIALSLMVTVALLRRMPALAAKIPNQWVPAYAVGLGLVEALGQGLLNGWPWTAILARGVITGVMAIGMWEAGGKQVVRPFIDMLGRGVASVRASIAAFEQRFFGDD
jgi:hypothetical protein